LDQANAKIVHISFFVFSELFCVVFFSVEYILLLVTKLPVWRFVFQLTNMLDLISILPYYLFLFVDNHNDGQSLFRVFRVVRIFRIFRLSRYVTWFKILNAAITESGVPLIMMLFVLLIGAVFFASIMYFLERGTWSDTQQLYLIDGNVSPFQSIPACMYFVFISMCTVGYGTHASPTVVLQLSYIDFLTRFSQVI
jgi:hypothetical protein